MKANTIRRTISRLGILTVLLLFPLAKLAAADLKLAAVFSDHMVLQREKPVTVWGWADSGENVTVEFAHQKKTATANGGGKWLVQLDPLLASAESRTLVVRSGKENRKVEIQDVLVGEVWLGSGQSNMELPVSKARDFEVEKAAAKLPLIRMFKEESGPAKTAAADGKGRWLVCAPETVGSFSATLYFFGRELQRELKVPVGLINSSVGGTPIESWVAIAAQAQVPELKPFLAAEAKAEAEFNEAKAKARYDKDVSRWEEQSAKAKAEGKPAPVKPWDPVMLRKLHGGMEELFNGKIAPLIPYAIRGVLWYQGESNANPGKGRFYQFELPTLVTDWRARWGEELPFAWVQLPNIIREGDDWSLVREAELKTLRLPHTGMAITVDIGEPNNIHPVNKQEVGRRLSLWALGEVYGRKMIATSGPLPAGHEVRGSEMSITFKHTDGGLKAKEGNLQGFVMAGTDRKWRFATARIEGDKVIVTSSEVIKPVAVRYAWEANPQCNLYNGVDLPASPFRTDNWAGMSQAPEKQR